MARLYELTQNYNNLLEVLDNPEIPQEMITEAINAVGEEFEEKAENLAKVIKSIEVDINGYKEEEQRLCSRRESLENRVATLKEYLDNSMKATGKLKIKGKVFTLAIQKNAPSVDILNEEAIPEEYFVVKKNLSKKDILAALKEGQVIPGAAIKQTESLRIR